MKKYIYTMFLNLVLMVGCGNGDYWLQHNHTATITAINYMRSRYGVHLLPENIYVSQEVVSVWYGEISSRSGNITHEAFVVIVPGIHSTKLHRIYCTPYRCSDTVYSR